MSSAASIRVAEADTATTATEQPGWTITLDLAALAEVGRGERIRVQAPRDRTLELFDQTLRLLAEIPREHHSTTPPGDRFIPRHRDLRSRFFFAEALGGYDILNDVIDRHAAMLRYSTACEGKLCLQRLSEGELRRLEEYHEHLQLALGHAHRYLLDNSTLEFSAEELRELHDLLRKARDRVNRLTSIIGAHLIREIERAVQRLHEYHAKIRQVQKSVSGIFLIDREVMFIDTHELIHCINTVFRGVGNPYLADNIDGMLLLAARNLLIEVISFYSYYGKEQVYSLFRKRRGGISPHVVTYHIRQEIAQLFDACQQDNKLVLTRVMQDAHRDFELSIAAIGREAETRAVDKVSDLFPAQVADPAPRPGPRWWQRLLRALW